MIYGYCSGCKVEKELPRDNSKYCSRECWLKNWKPHNLGKKGKESHSFGIKLSEEHKRKISLSRTGVNTGDKNHMWKGGRIKQVNGYMTIINRNHPKADRGSRIYEHILVMEKKLGRYLTPEEVVHHIDGIKDNNLPENLHLFESNSKHTLYHYEIKKAVIDELKLSGFNYNAGFRGY